MLHVDSRVENSNQTVSHKLTEKKKKTRPNRPKSQAICLESFIVVYVQQDKQEDGLTLVPMSLHPKH